MRRRRLLIIGFVVGVIVGAAAGWFFFGDTIRQRLGQERFGPVVWQDRQRIDEGARIGMAGY